MRIYLRMSASRYQNIGACGHRMCAQDKGALSCAGAVGDSDTAVEPRAVQIDHHMCSYSEHASTV